MIRPILLALGLVAGLGAASPGDAKQAIPAPASLPGDSVYQLQAPLRAADGRTVQWRGLRGKPRIATMFYANCPYMCPLIIEAGKGIDKSLSPAERSRLGVVMVSIDPARDTPAALTALAAKRKIDTARWLLLQPRPQDLRALSGVLQVRYRALADGEFNHTSVWVLLDANGRVLARTEQMTPQPDPAFLAAVRKALAAPLKPAK
jgi:protein SCO1/2